MTWFRGILALLRTGEPEGLSWEQRKLLNRWIKRRGLGARLASLQLEKVLGGPELGTSRAFLGCSLHQPLRGGHRSSRVAEAAGRRGRLTR